MGKDHFCLFCSSGAVYKPSCNIISEEFERGGNPNWGQYGIDKKEAEDFIINSSIPFVIFRPTYIYGENNNLYRAFRDVIYMLDIHHLIDDGLYVPTISLKDGLKRTYEWYINKK